ncbi:DUF3108 domain-containing protein [Polaromonas sp.]|jgi:hypothetical protein|uniref:DUF3108 domain-containing protein n=1 Tax=Polaromonas sp. TaxID=1869339 RepID=UPI002C15DDDE|nr:DUF3108 domain-containing protein [Polaromonas sp.]HQS33145.1 DUF3108 domain-containing protein [Polaromonas sp.]HQS92400.1 DUF3108 domain-containing protein [Polaromonas sp.]
MSTPLPPAPAASPDPRSTGLTATPRRGPGGRALLVLAALVLAVHGWLLTAAPARISPAAAPVAALVTRSIEPAPPAPPAPAVEPAPPPRPAPKPVRKRILKPKRPPAQALPALPAPELIAPAELPAEPVAETPPVAADANSAAAAPEAAASQAGADAALATASAASAPSSAVAAAAPASAPVVAALPETTAVTAMALPASARLAYKMTGLAKGLTYYANAELLWRNAGSSYDARMTVSALFLGSRSLASTGQVDADGLAPSRFADKSRNEVAAHFEPDKGLVTFSANTPSVPWIKGAQDRVTVFLQLAGMLAANPAAFPAGASISLYTVGPRSADVWTFVVEGDEAISLPAGDMATLKLSRKPRGEYDQKVEIWLAPSLGYLPVRSKITQSNGDFVDQQLSEVNAP